MLKDSQFKEKVKVISEGIAEILIEKQQAYGDAFTYVPEIMKILYPNGISLQQYDSVFTIIRVLDKIFRIATGARTEKDPFGEDPWQDINGYSLLELIKKFKEKNNIGETLNAENRIKEEARAIS